MLAVPSRIAFVLTSALFVTCNASAAQILRPQLVVRTYGATTLAASDWKAAVRETNAILGAVDVDIVWLTCTAVADSGADGAACTIAPGPNEVILRIISGPEREFRGALPLGESLIDPTTRIGTLATVYLNRVGCLAHISGIDTGTLLGRAIAHELGHLLLGTSTHSTRGLMRPIWTRDDLVRGRAADWRIVGNDGRRMRAALDARLSGSRRS